MIQIIKAITQEQLDQVRNMMVEFLELHRKQHLNNIGLLDQYFDDKAFENELESLPGPYSPPRGRLLLALYNGQPAGCVALKEIDEHTCEMKRMFVYSQFHGQGVARALADTLIHEAQRMGYISMKLDSSFSQKETQLLYQAMGFEKIAPYYSIPKSLHNWVVFMERKL